MLDTLNGLSGIEFENLCQNILESLGFTTETTKASGDGGIDIIAHINLVMFSGKYVIQCKRYSGSVGEPIIRDLYGVVTSERANKGILITTGYFTQSAINFSEDKNIELIDGEMLCQIIKQNNISLSEINNSPEYILHDELKRTGLSLDEYQYYFGDEEEASDFIICKQELTKCDSAHIRAKAIAILYSRLDRILFNENNINFDYSFLALQGCGCIEKYALPILSSKPKSEKGKRIKYNTMYIMCLCDIVRGNLSEAVIRYDELLRSDVLEHYTQNTDTNKCKLHILRAICSLLRILDSDYLLELYGTKYQEVINDIVVSNNEIINNPSFSLKYPGLIPTLEKENSTLYELDYSCDNTIIVPVESLTDRFDWIEQNVSYNIHQIAYNEGKLKITGEFRIDMLDSSKTVTTNIEFKLEPQKIEQEKKRLELLL